MANTNPTVIAAHLNDTELRSSIDSLVKHVDKQATAMAMSMDAAVSLMKQSLQQLGNVRIDLGGARGGASLTKGQSELKAEVKETTIAYDQMAHAMSRATSNKTIIDAYDMQIQLLLEDLKKARHDIEFFQQAAASPYIGNKAEYGQRATASAQEAERLMRVITELEQKKQALQGMMRPQGDTIKNYIHDLQKVNPELEQLNQQYRNGTSLLQQQATSAQQVVSATEQEARGAERFTSALETNEQYAKRVAEILRNTPIMNESYEQSMRGRGGNAQDSAVEIKKNFQAYEDFASAIAHVLNVQRNEVILADERIVSYNKLQATLTQLQQAYQKLTSRERESDNGKALASNIQEVQRAIQKVQTQMQRPVNLKAVLGLDEKTLDDIAYKIRMLQSYRQGIVLTSPNASKEIDQVNKSLEQLQKQQREVMGANANWVTSNNAVTRSLNYMKNRLAFILTVGTMSRFVNDIYDIRSQYELLERSMGILFNSMQAGSKVFAELNSMALKSPFTTIELGAAAKQLSAYDIAAKDVVDTTRRLADMAAAVGVPIERLTYALGQIKAYGYLNARDARMFANAGIPLVKNLADMYTQLEGRLVSVGDVYDRIKKKAISFEDVLKVVNEMTDEGGRFFNFQEKAADTLKVKYANLTLAYNNMLNQIGKSNAGLLTAPLSIGKSVFENWRMLNNALKSLIVTFGLLKTAQFLNIYLTEQIAAKNALAAVTTKKFVLSLVAAKKAMLSFFTNPTTWIGAITVALGTYAFSLNDIKNAADELSKSFTDNATETSNRIDKFLADYQEQLSKGLSADEMAKMWERIREEIEETSKAASHYIKILEQIPGISERISKAESFLEQQQIIQEESKRLAESGAFTSGLNDFVIDGLLTKLEYYQNSLNDIKQDYGELNNLLNETGLFAKITMAGWAGNVRSVNDEFHNLENILNKANLTKILGDGSVEERLANLRSFAELERDALLASEKGQKLNLEARTKLNIMFDQWIAKQAISKRLISEEQASIESNRTAWEDFFNRLRKNEKDALDYLIKTNQLGSQEFQKIWKTATDRLKEESQTSYDAIKDQIADLRNTPDIVIRVIYSQEKESLDAQQKQFKKDFLTPKGTGVLSLKTYQEEEKRLTQAYGRFQKKQGEDNVEWEKRLGEQYQSNAKKIKSLNTQLKNRANLATVNRQAKEKELKSLQDEQTALNKIAKNQGFDYDQFAKNKKTKKEDVLGKALAKEVEMITNITKKYKEYWNMGVNSTDAINKVAKEYNKTLDITNSTLAKFGITGTKTASELAQMDLRTTKAYIEDLLQMAQAKGNAKGVEALEKAKANLATEITKEDYTKYVDSLNSALSRLNEEYELSLDLQANPELGESFAAAFEIPIDNLPKTLEDYSKRYVELLNKYFKAAGQNIELPSLNLTNDDLNAFKIMVENGEISKQAYDAIVKGAEQMRQKTKKESDEHIKDWQQLIEKYGEFEAKISKIQKEAVDERVSFVKQYGTSEQQGTAIKLSEKIETTDDPEAKQELINQLKALTTEIAGTDAAKINIKVAIDESETTKIQDEYFNEFQKSPEWLIAIGDLSGLTHNALRTLIRDLQDFQRANNKLSPEQTKKLSRAIKTLQREMRKDNPFLRLKDVIEEARNRIEPLQKDLEKLEAQYEPLNKKVKDNIALTASEQKQYDKLGKEIDKTKKEIKVLGKVSAKDIVDALNEAWGVVNSVTSSIGEMFAAFGNEDAAEALKMLDGVIGKAMEFAKIGSSLGGAWGAAIGGFLGGLMGLFTSLADIMSGNADITKKIEISERAVKRLENAYKRLDDAIKHAFGTEVMGITASMIENKKLQLTELKRQERLELSRTSKNRDEDKIIDLQGQIMDMEQEIKQLQEDIVNNFLNISSASDAVSDMVTTIIDALRNGEDAMASFNETINDMIANMIKQVVASQVIGPLFQSAWDDIAKRLQDRSNTLAQKLAYEQKEYDNIASSEGKGYIFYNNPWGRGINVVKDSEVARNTYGRYATTFDAWKAYQEEVLKQLQNEIDKANTPTMDDVRDYAESLRGISPEIEGYIDTLNDILREMGLIKDTTKDKSLSLLQQGIQGITEDTAGALEGYLNIVSQRMFYHSTLLEEIRDRISSFDANIQLGTLGQMLLQLQNSYQVQMSIQNILQGTLTPSGRAFMVELNS